MLIYSERNRGDASALVSKTLLQPMLADKWRIIIVLVCSAFAVRALGLIDATGPWKDELYTVGKSFQPQFGALLDKLRNDTHPPAYYTLMWVWGVLGPQTITSLRLFSWFAYLGGGIVMMLQSQALAQRRPRQAMAIAALMAFCSPFPVRFAIEGKGYALLVLFIALAWWWRRVEKLWAYGTCVALSALTHYYGLFLFGATLIWDSWHHRWQSSRATALALLPAIGWLLFASSYLFRDGTGAWIGTPDFGLMEDTLARAIGRWPLPKIGILLAIILAIQHWGLEKNPCNPKTKAINKNIPIRDKSGLQPTLLMVVGVVMISFWKPLAFSRYFVVILPALIPWLGVRASEPTLNSRGRLLGITALSLLLISWWWQSFRNLDPALTVDGARESNQFHVVSHALRGETYRYSNHKDLLILSDRMEVNAGRMNSPEQSWKGELELYELLTQDLGSLPNQIWLADSGSQRTTKRNLKALRKQPEKVGYRCEKFDLNKSYAAILRCTLKTTT